MVVHRRNDDVGPEGRAVLAQPRPFVLEASLFARPAQLFLRPMSFARLRGVEDPEVFADDLVGTIALDALGARVPACHAPLRIEHEDGVVLHRFDEKPETLLALAQQLLLAP